MGLNFTNNESFQPPFIILGMCSLKISTHWLVCSVFLAIHYVFFLFGTMFETLGAAKEVSIEMY